MQAVVNKSDNGLSKYDANINMHMVDVSPSINT